MEKLITKRYLNKALNAVVHPVSDDVQKATEEQKLAANDAIAQQVENSDFSG